MVQITSTVKITSDHSVRKNFPFALFLFMPPFSYLFPLSLIINRRGGIGIPGSYTPHENNLTHGLKFWECKVEDLSEYWVRIGPELLFLNIPAMISASKEVGGSSLNCLYEPSILP